MRYAGAAIVGLLVGAALALALLFYNPLPTAQGVEPGANDWKLSYRFPLDGTLLLAHAGRLRLPVKPVGSGELWESTISRSLLQAVALSDRDGGAVAVASRISLPSSESRLLTRGVMLTDHWLLTVPGEGTLMIQAESNVWPFLKEALVPVWYLGRSWDGPQSYRPTVGPGFRNTAALEGVSGRFAGRHGTVTEQYRVQRLTAMGAELVGELYMNLDEDTPLASE